MLNGSKLVFFRPSIVYTFGVAEFVPSPLASNDWVNQPRSFLYFFLFYYLYLLAYFNIFVTLTTSFNLVFH